MKKGQGESPGNRVNKSSQSTVNGEGPVVRVNRWGEKADYDSSKKSEWGGVQRKDVRMGRYRKFRVW